jgi:RNA polymerase primary sigma factor
MELARGIEAAQRGLAEALVRSTDALRALRGVIEQAKQGPADALQFFLGIGDDWDEGQPVLDDLSTVVSRLEALRSSSEQREEARAQLMRALPLVRLSRQAMARVVGELEARLRTRVHGRSALLKTIATLTSCRQSYESAKGALVRANMGLVFTMANKRSHPGLSLHDLVQEGTMGLMRAVDRFDHRRDIKLGTYAGWWIRHAINRALSDYARTIRIPVHTLDDQYKLRRAAQQFSQRNGREPTELELSTRTGLSPEKVGVVLSIPREPMSLEAPLWEDGDRRLADLIPDRDASSPIDDISGKQAQQRLRRLIESLAPREAEVIRLRFGIDCPEPLTLEEVGRKYRLSRERVRQIESEALGKLHRRAASEKLDSLLIG